MELLGSEAFFLLLSNFTGLKLHFLAPEEKEEEGEEGTSGGTSFEHMPGASNQEERSSRGQTDKSGAVSENKDGQKGMWTSKAWSLFFTAHYPALGIFLFCFG